MDFKCFGTSQIADDTVIMIWLNENSPQDKVCAILIIYLLQRDIH